MLIDWFTVGAQIGNFIILVLIMKRYLYAPIVAAIDAREKGIATVLTETAAHRAEAQREHEEFSQKNLAFDRERSELHSRVIAEVSAERTRLMAAAQRAAEDARADMLQTLRADTVRLEQTICLRLQQEVIATARQVLTELAGVTLEEHICVAFVQRLRELPDEEKRTLGEALRTAKGPVSCSSAFDMNREQQRELERALNEIFSSAVRVQFAPSPNLICGIELTANGQRVAWSAGDFLSMFEKTVLLPIAEQEIAAQTNRLQNSTENSQGHGV